MQGAIRNIATLKKWFFSNGVPFFTLTYSGQTNQVIQRNTAIEELDEAWSLLETNVLAQAEYGRATMHLIVYNKTSGPNNPTARTNIDVLPMNPTPNYGMPGIGSIPSGFVDESKIEGMINEAREKWDMERRLEDLEAQIKNPNDDWTEKMMTGIERIGATPFGQALIMKFFGGALPSFQPQPINGAPGPSQPGDIEEDSFESDIERTSELLGVDDVTLARKLRELVEANPQAAKQLLS
jgi:hypothetical protein